MREILDLSVFAEETLDIRMADGKMLHLRKPTQALAIAMVHLRNLKDDTPPESALAAQNAVVTKIMNHNADGLAFTPASVEALTLPVKNAILSGYAEFAQELTANPSSSSLRSQEKPERARKKFFNAFTRRRNTRE